MSWEFFLENQGDQPKDERDIAFEWVSVVCWTEREENEDNNEENREGSMYTSETWVQQTRQHDLLSSHNIRHHYHNLQQKETYALLF